ncbi:MAG: CDGSH iron-sulfur domain-containing protein [Chloroflexaceae bacterium]|nr:CDGSH iron-sulfur domain-containing protein [Chloroflexaceae bacterium]
MAEETVTITLVENGPLALEGTIKVLDANGNEVPVKGNKAYLCRCGASENKPFCDGAHKGVGFTTSEPQS